MPKDATQSSTGSVPSGSGAADGSQPPATSSFDPIARLQSEAEALATQIGQDQQTAKQVGPNGKPTSDAYAAQDRLLKTVPEYRSYLVTLTNSAGYTAAARAVPGSDLPYITTIDPGTGAVHFTVNPNGNGDLAQAQLAVAQANAAAIKGKADYDAAQAKLDQQRLDHQIDQDAWQRTTTENAQKLAQANADADRALRAQEIGVGQQNADTSRFAAETGRMAEGQAGPIEAMRAAGSIGDAAVRGNLIPSMLPYMVPKGGLNNFNSALAALGGVSGAKVTPTATAPMPPFDPTTVGGQTSANALAALTGAQNTLPAVASFQAPQAAPSPIVAGAPAQPQPVAAPPAAAPLAAPLSLEQILQSAKAQVFGPMPNPYGTGGVGPPAVGATN